MKLPEQIPTSFLAEAFAAIELPEPASVEAISIEGAHAIFGVEFEPDTVPAVVLRIEADPRRRPSVPVEMAAMKLARGRVPVPPATALEGLPWPALVLRREPGLVRRQAGLPERLVDILLQLGRLEAPSWGDAVVDGLFVPTESSWRAYWERRIEEAFAQTHASHTHLGWAGLLHDQALSGLPALDDARFSLVHGDFGPENLLLTDDGMVSAVLDWDQALLGDPLIDWVSSLEAPPKLLATGVGDRNIPAFQDPGAIERLQVYQRTRALERFAECGRAWMQEPGSRRRAQHLEAAIALAKAALEPQRVSRRLASIKGPLPDIAGPVQAKQHAVLRRRVFETLRHPLPPVALPLASALAAVAAEADLFAEQASTLLRSLPIQREPWAPAPLKDWDATREAAPAGSGVGLALLALGQAAFDAVHGHVGDGTRRGLLMQVQCARGQGWQDAVAGYAAAIVLGRDTSAYPLDGIPDDLPGDPDEVIDGLVFTEWLETPHADWVPLLCWALPYLPEHAAERVAGQLLG